jgi:hypothetical protein
MTTGEYGKPGEVRPEVGWTCVAPARARALRPLSLQWTDTLFCGMEAAVETSQLIGGLSNRINHDLPN